MTNSVERSSATEKASAGAPSNGKEWWKRGTLEYAEGCRHVDGEYVSKRDWVNDEKGYVLIRVNREEGRIEVGFCVEVNTISFIVYGKKPADIYYEFAKHNLLSRHEHSAYLGMELEKARLALEYDIEYVQDEELVIPPFA